MKTFTIADIRSWKPCYDPSRYLPEDWSGTALDMLEHPNIPDKDKLWLVRRYPVMTAKGLRLFAVDCAKRAQAYPKNYTPDTRLLKAIEIAERFANGEATESELDAAYAAARAADAAAAYAAYAAEAAADAAAAYAAYAAARAAYAAEAAADADAADAAAAYAAEAAADAAAYAAAYAADAAAYAAYADAADAAAYAAAYVERKKQVNMLIEMFKSGKTDLFVE